MLPLGLKLDVQGPHRLIPVAPCDWHLLGCRTRNGGAVYINTTGTRGVASAAYWWGRLAGSAVRLQHYIDGTLYPLWVLLVADDLIAISTRPTFRRALLLVFLVLDVLGFPLSWNKDCVAPVLKWVEGPSWSPRPRGSSGSRIGWSASSRNASSEWGTSPKSWAGAPSPTALWATGPFWPRSTTSSLASPGTPSGPFRSTSW